MTEVKNSSYVFGPVPSRRLGRSLGVDLVPFKTCTYNCIYCQLGRTTNLTVERRDYVPVSRVLEDVEAKLAKGPLPDYITLSGSGEPTLHSGINEVIKGIKSLTEIPVAVLTNGSLLYLPEVRLAVADADLVVPSIDAGNSETFRLVNRPHQGIKFDEMVQGLIAFAREFKGMIWLEVFIVAGLTDSDAEVMEIAAIASRVSPDRVQLNTATRPAAEAGAKAVPLQRMQALAELFEPAAEVIADFRGVHEQKEFTAKREDVFNMLARRPCSVDDIAAGLGLHRNEAVKYVEELLAEKAIVKEQRGNVLYYRVYK